MFLPKSLLWNFYVLSRAEGSDETWALRLERGKATATLERERRRARQVAGTTVLLSDLEPDVLRVLTQRKVVDYLRARRGPALARGEYSIEVVEGRSSELVSPEKPEGLRLDVPARPTLWGRIEFALFVSPPSARRRRVAVVGRAGTTIVDDIIEIEEFAVPPWSSGQVTGEVVFAALQQTAGRRAVLRDRDAFPVFVDAVKAIEPVVRRASEKLAQDVDAQTSDRIAETLRRVFGRVLKELADLDNPMQSPVGDEEGVGALFEPAAGRGADRSPSSTNGSTGSSDPGNTPDLPELDDSEAPNLAARREARPDRRRNTDLPSVSPDPEPGEARSRFDAEDRVVLYNDRHEDYLAVRDDEAGLLDYLATLVAKEYVVFNNPRSSSGDLAEEMVRVLVRVRRHLPKRR